MNRDQLSELLSAYIDGEVSDRERAVVERVLREDASARQLMEELRNTINAIASLPRHAAPPTLATDLDAQLERAELLGCDGVPPAHIQVRETPWAAWMAVAAMLGVVVVAGWWFLADDGTHRFAGVKSKIAATDTQGRREIADRPAPPPAASTGGNGALPSISTGLTVESQLIAGVDPATLTKQSFEPETLRLQVVALNGGERDAIADKVVKLLAEQKTENLAKRRSGTGGPREPVGSFFLVGKPGVNFNDSTQQQLLVRIPRSRAGQVVEDLAAAVGSQDRLALKAGLISVRGATSVRNVLQMVGQKSPGADTTAAITKRDETRSPEAESKPAVADDRTKRAGWSADGAEIDGTSNRFDPLGGLAKVIGLDPQWLARRGGAVADQAVKPNDSDEGTSRDVRSVATASDQNRKPDEAASAVVSAAGQPPASSGAERAGAKEGAETPRATVADKKSIDRATPDTKSEESRSLVKRREFEAEKARAKAKAAENAIVVSKETTGGLHEDESARLDAMGAKRPAAAGLSGALEHEDDYVTMVIEFVVPSLQPKPVPPATKPKTDPASKTSK